MTSATIILADDDAAIRLVVGEALRDEGWQVVEACDAPELVDLVNAGEGDLVITDVLMPGGNGLELLPSLQEKRPDVPFLVMSAQNTLSTAIAATQQGAHDYIPKPFDLDELTDKVRKALESTGRVDSALVDSGSGEESLLVGRSPAMQAVYRVIARVVQTELTVLITGESGTGKELVARALHEHGPRGNRPFVAVNMAAIPKELIESELFGHERGAFTGASQRSEGRFGQAQGGTLFLDEIGDMPIDAQTRLLRVLQEGEYHSVGGTKIIRSDVRVIAATHQDLAELVQLGKFREDLFYRLNVVPLRLPPLRERSGDLGDLAQHFLKRVSYIGLEQKSLDESAIAVLEAHSWPGNVRELENLLQRVCALYPSDTISGDIIAAELPVADKDGEGAASLGGATSQSIGEAIEQHLDRYFAAHGQRLPPDGLYQRILREIERPLIEKCLASLGGNQLKAAKLLGLNRNTLRKKITELGIDPSISK